MTLSPKELFETSTNEVEYVKTSSENKAEHIVPEEDICPYCFNAYVAAKYPNDDPFETELDDTNDASSSTIGNSTNGFQLYFNSGNGKPCNIEICQWKENGYRGRPGWATIGIYYPKFCPECGRPLDEYKVDERGTSYERKRVN